MPPPSGDYARRRYTRETLERMTLTGAVPLPPIARAHADKPAGRPGFRGSERGTVPTRAIPGGFDRRCDACGRAFANSHLLERHLATHRSEMPHACSTCDRRFSTLAALAAHRASHRASASSSASDAPSIASRRIRDGDADGFSCATCGRRFLDATAFVKHKMAHRRAEREEAARAVRENRRGDGDAERRGAGEGRRGEGQRGEGRRGEGHGSPSRAYAPRESGGTIWASAAAKPRTLRSRIVASTTDVRRVAEDATPGDGDDARESGDVRTPVAGQRGFIAGTPVRGESRRGDGDGDGDGDRRRGEEDAREHTADEKRSETRPEPDATAAAEAAAMEAEEEARRARAAAGKRARARLRAAREAAAAAAAAAEAATAGDAALGDTEESSDAVVVVADAVKSAALRARAAARAAARAGRQRAWGATSGVGSFFAPRDPAAFDSPPANDRERDGDDARVTDPARRPAAVAAAAAREAGRARAHAAEEAAAEEAARAMRGWDDGSGGGGWGATEEPRPSAAPPSFGLGAGGRGAGGAPGAVGAGGAGSSTVARARVRSHRTRGGGESDEAGSEDE